MEIGYGVRNVECLLWYMKIKHTTAIATGKLGVNIRRERKNKNAKMLTTNKFITISSPANQRKQVMLIQAASSGGAIVRNKIWKEKILEFPQKEKYEPEAIYIRFLTSFKVHSQHLLLFFVS